MAISSPYATQGPKQRDPLDYITAGAQIGGQMAQLTQMLEKQRAEMAQLNQRDLQGKLEHNPNYIQDNPDEIKRMIGTQYNLRPDSPETAKIYDQWATALKSPEDIAKIQTSLALLTTTKEPQPQPQKMEDKQAPPLEPKPEMAQPVTGNIAATQEREVMEKPGRLTYEQFKQKMMKESEKLPYPGGNSTEGKYRQGILNSPQQYDPNGPDPVSQAYKYYLTQEVNPDQLANWMISTRGKTPAGKPVWKDGRLVDVQSPLDKEVLGPPVKKTITNKNVQLANVENGKLRVSPSVRTAQDKMNVFSGIKTNFYPDMNESEVRNLVWEQNQDALVQKYGSKSKAIQALFHGDVFDPQSGLELQIAEPVDLTFNAAMNASRDVSKARVAVVEKANEQVDSILSRSKGVPTSDGTGEGWRILTYEEMQAERPELLKSLGAYGRFTQDKESWKAYQRHENRIFENLGGIEAILGQNQTADPKTLEALKLASEIESIQTKTELAKAKFGQEQAEFAFEVAESDRDFQLQVAKMNASERAKGLPLEKTRNDLMKRMNDFKTGMIKKDPASYQGWKEEDWIKNNPTYALMFDEFMIADGAVRGQTESQTRNKMRKYKVERRGILGIGYQDEVESTPEAAKARGWGETVSEKEPTRSAEQKKLMEKYYPENTKKFY